MKKNLQILAFCSIVLPYFLVEAAPPPPPPLPPTGIPATRIPAAQPVMPAATAALVSAPSSSTTTPSATGAPAGNRAGLFSAIKAGGAGGFGLKKVDKSSGTNATSGGQAASSGSRPATAAAPAAGRPAGGPSLIRDIENFQFKPRPAAAASSPAASSSTGAPKPLKPSPLPKSGLTHGGSIPRSGVSVLPSAAPAAPIAPAPQPPIAAPAAPIIPAPAALTQPATNGGSLMAAVAASSAAAASSATDDDNDDDDEWNTSSDDDDDDATTPTAIPSTSQPQLSLEQRKKQIEKLENDVTSLCGTLETLKKEAEAARVNLQPIIDAQAKDKALKRRPDPIAQQEIDRAQTALQKILMQINATEATIRENRSQIYAHNRVISDARAAERAIASPTKTSAGNTTTPAENIAEKIKAKVALLKRDYRTLGDELMAEALELLDNEEKEEKRQLRNLRLHHDESSPEVIAFVERMRKNKVLRDQQRNDIHDKDWEEEAKAQEATKNAPAAPRNVGRLVPGRAAALFAAAPASTSAAPAATVVSAPSSGFTPPPAPPLPPTASTSLMATPSLPAALPLAAAAALLATTATSAPAQLFDATKQTACVDEIFGFLAGQNNHSLPAITDEIEANDTTNLIQDILIACTYPTDTTTIELVRQGLRDTVATEARNGTGFASMSTMRGGAAVASDQETLENYIQQQIINAQLLDAMPEDDIIAIIQQESARGIFGALRPTDVELRALFQRLSTR